MKDNQVYIEQILDSISKIEKFTNEMTLESFKSDAMAQSACILQLLLIGEVSKKVSKEFKSALEVPWSEILAFRNKAIHEYFSMELDLVWETIKNDLPNLKSKLQKGF